MPKQIKPGNRPSLTNYFFQENKDKTFDEVMYLESVKDNTLYSHEEMLLYVSIVNNAKGFENISVYLAEFNKKTPKILFKIDNIIIEKKETDNTWSFKKIVEKKPFLLFGNKHNLGCGLFDTVNIVLAMQNYPPIPDIVGGKADIPFDRKLCELARQIENIDLFMISNDMEYEIKADILKYGLDIDIPNHDIHINIVCYENASVCFVANEKQIPLHDINSYIVSETKK